MNEFADADGIKVGNAISSQSTTSWVDGGALVAFYAVLDCWTKQCAFAGPTTGRNILIFCAFVYFIFCLCCLFVCRWVPLMWSDGSCNWSSRNDLPSFIEKSRHVAAGWSVTGSMAYTFGV